MLPTIQLSMQAWIYSWLLWGIGGAMVCFVVYFLIWILTPFSARVPVTWMITTSCTEVTIKFFFNFIKVRSLEITPVIVMSYCDQTQLNAISAVYPDSTVLLCWWHVLHTMQMHFWTEEISKLWDHISEWGKTPDQSKFESWWADMQTDPSVPLSFIDYLKTNWMLIVHMWAGSAQQNHMIFQEGNTNMLIKS